MGLAVCGWAYNTVLERRTQEHEAQIDRVNKQLGSLYGVLFSCVQSTAVSYGVMLQKLCPDADDGEADSASTELSDKARTLRELIKADPLGPIAADFRRWHTKVLQPLNR